MCGITGVFHFDRDQKVNRELLQEMTDVISYRGPDGSGYFVEDNVGLGHRRLSIIDLSTGNQPMFSESGDIVIILNGEIYNYIELKEELIQLGHHFRTTSDTEVIIKAYEQWGISCQDRFNGMWAFALWDKVKNRLFLSRDRIGEKPLHYAVFNNTFLFGSEIKSFFQYGMPREIRPELMEIYAVFKSIPAPHTFFKNIYKLLPGHYILAGQDGFKEYKYWDLPEIDEKNLLRNKHYIYERFRELFIDSVKIRMRSDVPFGAFLSGGLDSSSVVSVMSGISSYPVKTFTIGYEEKEYDESRLAQMVADRFKTEHHPGNVEKDSYHDAMRNVVFHYDEPFGDSSAIPTGYVSKYAARHVKMVLTGDGGDEVLSGYPSYQGVLLSQKLNKTPLFIQKLITGSLYQGSGFFKGSIRYRLNRYHNILSNSSKEFNERILDKMAKPGYEIIRKLIRENKDTWKTDEFFEDFMKACPYRDEFYRMMYINFKFDLPNDYLVKVDRMSMAYSLETRVPFLDHRLIEFMAGVDKTVKLQGMETKSILRRTIGKDLPRELLHAKKKGFRVPVREWLKSETLIREVRSRIRNNDLINEPVFNKILVENARSEYDYGNLIWSVMVLDAVVNGT